MNYFQNRLGIEWQILEFFNLFANNIVTLFFLGISFLGAAEILLGVVLLFYYCIDKEFGKKLVYVTMGSMVINNIFKVLFSADRPFQFEGREHLRKSNGSLDSATGTSFPSGHSQNTGTLYTAIFRQYKLKWVRIICIALLILVPISRLYLGVHFPGDVVIGLSMGIGLAFGLGFLYDKFHGTKWFYLISSALVIIALPFLIMHWHSADAKDLFSTTGVFMAVLVTIFIEEKWIKFSTDVVWWKKLLRLLAGVAVALGIKVGVKVILPENNICTLIRYFLVVLLPMGVLPFAFKKQVKEKEEVPVNNEQ